MFPDLPEYSGAVQFFSDTEAARRFDDLLADFGDLRLQSMAETHVSKAILSHTVPGIEAALDKRKAIHDAAAINDFLAERILHYPDRFGGFATLPMQSALMPRTNWSVASNSWASMEP